MPHGDMEPLDWVTLGKVPTASPVIPGLLNEGESGSLIGQGAVGKSLLALDIALRLASGSSVLGKAVGSAARSGDRQFRSRGLTGPCGHNRFE
ncbi:AAA family ATPase, partial [Mycolicibacterium neoaurum]|uniref:AAA family ATPase n=3 Tax=Mycobacteriaceae TaxID=1762 RepID=UPI0039867D87